MKKNYLFLSFILLVLLSDSIQENSADVLFAQTNACNSTVCLNVPFESQLSSISEQGTKCRYATGTANCGPASFAMVLKYYGINTSAFELAGLVRGKGNECATGQANYTDPIGNSIWQTKILDNKSIVGDKKITRKILARNNNIFTEIKQELTNGFPVIVLLDNGAYYNSNSPRDKTNGYVGPYNGIDIRRSDWTAWNINNWRASHLVVVVGFDAQGNYYIHDPLRHQAYTISEPGYLKIGATVFEKAVRTHNYYAASFRIASANPILTSPDNNHTTTNGLWPTLSWSSTSNGPFEIRVSKNANFSDCVVCENVTGKTYRPSGSSADGWMREKTGKLYWRVRVVGGTWSSSRWFHNTIVRTPTHTPTPVSIVPTLQSPANDHTTTNGLWPTLSWSSTSNGPFEIRVSKNANFSDCVVCENVTGKTYRPSGSSADGWMREKTGKLYWRVRVVGGTWSSSRWFHNTLDITHTPSATRSRTPVPHTPTWTPTRPPPTITSSPTASPRPTDAELTMPILSSPADGATDVSTKVELDWQDVTRGNVNRYEVEICIETSRGSNNWNCDKYDTNGAESRWKVWDRTGKIFPQRKIRWRVNANDGTKDGPVSGWRYFQPRYTYPTNSTVSGDTWKLSISRESNDVTYQCKYNFGAFGSNGSWSSVDKSSFSGSSCSFSINTMRSKGANRGRTIYWIITSDSKKTLGDFDGRENTDGRSWSFSMP